MTANELDVEMVVAPLSNVWGFFRRSVWIADKHRPEMLASVGEGAAAEVGADACVVPELYKMLVYGEGVVRN
jgi:hypothetical protein